MSNNNDIRQTFCLSLILVLLLLSGCGALAPIQNRPAETAFAQPLATTLGQQVSLLAKPHAGQSGFLILDGGEQAFLARAALIETAERSIDAQYYIWNSDLSGRYLARRLLLAADRGVRVRLLLDDINVGGRDNVLAALANHPNIQIRIFNPSAVRAGPGKWLAFITDFQRLNRRMHNKTFVVDAAIGIVGGRNIGDEYFDLHPKATHRDRDVLTAGPIVGDISSNFDVYWNSVWSYPIAQLIRKTQNEQDIVEQFAAARSMAGDTTGLSQATEQGSASGYETVKRSLDKLTWAPAELVYDPPAQDMQESTNTPKRTAHYLRRQVEQSQSEILIESAYLVLGDQQLDNLEHVMDKGIHVAALTNSLATNDLTTNHAAYARHRPAMLQAGIKLFELRPDAADCANWVQPAGYCEQGTVSLHAKTAVFDRKTLYVGSFNVNLRSIFLNGETVLVIHSPLLSQQVAADIEQAMSPDNSWQVKREEDGQLRWIASEGKTWKHEPEVGWWRRFKSGLISQLPIEKYL